MKRGKGPATVQLGARIPPSLRREVERAADREKVSLSEMTRRMLLAAIEKA